LLRGILTPELENSPPMLCNIFHSSEISHFNYSRQFLPEPTRSIGSVTSPLFQGNAISSFLETTLFTTYPKLTTNTELADKGIIPMTEEESWRGITAHTPKLDQNMTHVLTEESVKAAEEKIAAKEGEEYATTGLQEKMGAPLKQFTSLEHSKMRLRNRSFSFSAD
jgi:hypothetical protein